MMRRHIAVLVTAAVMGMVLPSRVDGAAKYAPCSLLTAEDLETALQGKVSGSDERDQTIPAGPFKGEIMSTCDWFIGPGAPGASLNVIRGPKNAQEQTAGLAELRAKADGLRKQGWTIERANIPGAECFSMKPPATQATARPGASCSMASKALAFTLIVFGPASIQQVKALADTVAAKLP